MTERPLSHRWDETIAAIRGAEVVPVTQKGGSYFHGIAVVLHVARPAFDHELLDGIDARLDLSRGRDAASGNTIWGKLSLMAPGPMAGVTRSYKFTPRDAGDLEQVEFRGHEHWSNIDLVVLIIPGHGQVRRPNHLGHSNRPS